VDVDVVCEAPQGDPINLEPENCDGWAWYEQDALPSPIFSVTDVMLAALRAGIPPPDLEIIHRQPMAAP
jgi:hypothetical protein